MTGLSRRQFGLLAGAAITTLAAPSIVRASGVPKVVVVGGGPGGATTARYIAKDARDAVDVTLIDANPRYTTCFFSNLYLAGMRSFESITHGYDALEANYGISFVNARAAAVERDAKEVVLADGSRVPYDRLVIAPGIDVIHESVPGYSRQAEEIMPHAWKAGPQTQLLKQRLDALEDGQQIVMVAPPNPYRCPPGPYERASMFAHVLKARGHTRSRIIILDYKPKFSKQALFAEGWEEFYPGMIEWYGPDVHGGILGVDPEAGTVETDFDTFTGALVNVIPAQKAGIIAREAGLADDSGFCPIDAASMRSALDDSIFILGDASIAGAMPKSAFSANSQAKVAAMNVRGDLVGSKIFPARFTNTCWSLIETDNAVKVGGQYAPGADGIASTSTFISQIHEPADLRKTNAEEAVGWYQGITADIFGA
ncbi:NAD(P)/FAD-dependent oxidoreductase [Breoghania sp.]|uniref:NAD(P)/FAD-dependent oxidoreductase n=1 Tax=Breoghania sp. TaxID=2065378 RepID=UPI0029CA4A81|nr:NAD(P)/FAD-dependent oxidoreductase [Breoghania sp.]